MMSAEELAELKRLTESGELKRKVERSTKSRYRGPGRHTGAKTKC